MKRLKRLIGIMLLGAVVGTAGVGAMYIYVLPELPDVNSLKDVQLQTPMRVFTSDGKLISQFGEKRRIPLPIQDIPLKMKQAFIATEDSRFYQNPGIDPIGIMRAALNLVLTGKKSQGASTITQQVARNFFLTRQKTYIRKIKEIFLALQIEHILSKDEILDLYLNKISLGYRAYGVGAAAQVYYGKSVNQLTLPQMAMIAGLPKAPSALNPLHDPIRAKSRRNVVLGRMLEQNYIDKATYQQAIATPLSATYHGAEIQVHAPYLAEMVRQEMEQKYGDKAYTRGLKVYTTVTSQRQLAAEKALRQNLLNYDMRHGFRGPVMHLWKDGQTPLSQQAITDKLATLPNYAHLRAATITDVADKQATAIIKGGQTITLNWDGMKWARRFISDDKQGNEPQNAHQILAPGDVIWVLPEADSNDYRLSQLPDASAAIVALRPDDGAIEAISGGFSFNQSKFNRAIQARRQVGSNIKPFIYSDAFASGMTLATLVNDAPVNQWDQSLGTAWRPKNSPPVYAGPLRLRVALAESKNVVSVRVVRKLGIDSVVQHLHLFGFAKDELPHNDTIALGSASLTPIQVVRGYATFANGGFLITPYFIDHISDSTDQIIYQAKPKIACSHCEHPQVPPTIVQLTSEPGNPLKQCPIDYATPEQLAPRIISQQNAFLVAQAMHSVITGGGSWAHHTGWNGTGWRALELHRDDIYGKSGTTNDSRDAWFSGFGPGIVVTSWVGFDDYTRNLGSSAYNNNLGKDQVYGGEFGGKTAQPAWIDLMRAALTGIPEHQLPTPPGIVSVRIDDKTGLLSNKTDYTSRFEYFIAGTQPTQYVQTSGSNSDSSIQDQIF
ncbi:penicillin-binding protein 1A [Celerinatantimonas yamalensis]|uniref:Penicillin-binding protein 1A n=1 Tax=Celerinatantimonas yamalensis TaxID=559956 RepID=A0ABW9G8K2_9GAMM